MNKTLVKTSLAIAYESTANQRQLKDPLKARSSIGRKQLISSLDFPKGAFAHPNMKTQANSKMASTRNNQRNLAASVHFENPLTDEALQSYLNTD